MSKDGRLSLVLHLLLHLAHSKRPLSSAEMGTMLGTNAVVVRRTLAGLREAGWIQSAKGHGGGWRLACELSAITLGDVHQALGEPSLLALGFRSEASACLVEQVVNQSLQHSLQEAEALLLAKFHQVTLADLAAEVARRSPQSHQEGHAHA